MLDGAMWTEYSGFCMQLLSQTVAMIVISNPGLCLFE